jgi:uncharacterized protein (TIGR03089 family)
MAENPVVRALTARVRRGGSEPLLTWYQTAEGARTELSVRTFANWVDKTANLLDSLGVEGRVAAPVSLAHPGHWMSLAWPVAAWQRGLCYLAGEPDADTELVVVGPQEARPHAGLVTIACSLHPLGLGLRGLPDGVLDFSGEALAQPDAHLAEPVDGAATAWLDGERELNHAALGTIPPQSGRVLLRPSAAWPTLAAAIVAPVLGGGSAVVVDGPADADALSAIAAAERATSAVA